MAILSMFLVNYIYAIISFLVCFLIYLQLKIYKPGLPNGLANTNLTKIIGSQLKK